jgi:cell division protein FtsZ
MGSMVEETIYMLEFDDESTPGRGPVIKVVGVGGGGGNAVNTMIEAGIGGVDFIVANTDGQVLEANQAPTKVHLGKALTKGLGAGANPEIGRNSALEDASRIAEVLAGADMVFVTAGMGGGTGTGAAPVIAQVAREIGALTVGVVTKPFTFEGAQRKKKAVGGIAELAKAVDALIVIPNDRLVTLAGVKMTLRDAFTMVDNVLVNAVRGISDLVLVPGLINVDFADVRTIMTGMGRALMGTGRGVGEKRALEAAQQAISSPLLEDVSINGATGILINVTGGPDLTLSEVTEAATLIEEAADPDANIIFGSVIDAHAGDEVRITVIATGFQPSQQDHMVPGASRGAVSSTGRRASADQMALPMSPASSGGYGSAAPMGYGGQQQPVHPGAHLAHHLSQHGMAAQHAAQHPAQYPMMQPAAVPQHLPGTPTAAWPPNMNHLGHLSAEATNMGRGARTVEAYAEPADGILDDFPEFPDSMTTPPASAIPTASIEWAPAVAAERPVIRPAVSPNSNLRRASAGTIPRVGTANELGVEENEYDKPTYQRRGILPPGQ